MTAVPKTHVFARGRPFNPHESVTGVLKYIPRARTPWQCFMHTRANIHPDDLKPFWNLGRGRKSPEYWDSGYNTNKTSVMEDATISMIPKTDLEKYMPDIFLGPKALVTPVSLMSARNGHRVTHDLLHSYDPYIGMNDKTARVDHDNVSPLDPNRVGLHPATIHCRSRIYRWLRRGPFFQDDHYFRRNVAQAGHSSSLTPEDALLARKVCRMAKKGKLKQACEEYRKFVSVPPVQVYRALTGACVSQGRLADAISIFEDGNARLFYVSRDPEVLRNVMRCAIKANNRSRVMWIFNIARGRFYENHIARVEIDAMSMYALANLALEFLCDANCIAEARTIYAYMAGDESIRQENFGAAFRTQESSTMCNFDIFERVGLQMRDAILQNKPVPVYDASHGAKLGVSKNVLQLSSAIVRSLSEASDDSLAASIREGCIPPQPLTITEDDFAALSSRFSDLDVSFVIRHSCFSGVKKLKNFEDQAEIAFFADRAAHWLRVLSGFNAAVSEDVAMPYLRKSKPSTTNVNLRVAWFPEVSAPTQRLPSDAGFTFHFIDNGRFVKESHQQPDTVGSFRLALQPVQSPVSAVVDVSQDVLTYRPYSKVIHSSINQHGANWNTVDASTAATAGGTGAAKASEFSTLSSEKVK